MRRWARKRDSICSSESPDGFAFYVALGLLKKKATRLWQKRGNLLKRKKEKLRERNEGFGEAGVFFKIFVEGIFLEAKPKKVSQ